MKKNKRKRTTAKKETLYHSRFQLSFSCSFSAQLIFAEVLGSELMFLRSFFFLIFLGLFGPGAFFLTHDLGPPGGFTRVFPLRTPNGAKECIV